MLCLVLIHLIIIFTPDVIVSSDTDLTFFFGTYLTCEVPQLVTPMWVFCASASHCGLPYGFHSGMFDCATSVLVLLVFCNWPPSWRPLMTKRLAQWRPLTFLQPPPLTCLCEAPGILSVWPHLTLPLTSGSSSTALRLEWSLLLLRSSSSKHSPCHAASLLQALLCAVALWYVIWNYGFWHALLGLYWMAEAVVHLWNWFSSHYDSFWVC